MEKIMFLILNQKIKKKSNLFSRNHLQFLIKTLDRALLFKRFLNV